MDMSPHPGQPRPLRHLRPKGQDVGLFRRKQLSDEKDERCPSCRERVPEGAVTCMMCGLALEPVRDAPRDAEAKRPVTSR
jgi:hypothetical protein